MLALVYFVLWTLYFLIGACLFSFLTVVAERLPRKESIVKGRSHCTDCGHVLSPGELIPCLSWLLLRGRCKSCGAKIPLRCLVMELLGGAGAMACFLRFEGEPLKALLIMAALSILAVVALMDMDTMEIWDRFILMLLVCGIAAFAVFLETGWLSRLIGCVVISLPMLLLALFVPGGFGGGDIKLMFAAGLLLGWRNTLCAAFIAILAGGAYGAWLLISKRAGRKEQFAFGPFLCAGIAAALLWGDAIVGWYTGLLK